MLRLNDGQLGLSLNVICCLGGNLSVVGLRGLYFRRIRVESSLVSRRGGGRMVLFDVLNVLVGAQGFKDAIVDFAPEDGGVGVVLSRVSSHVFGQAETLAADFALVWFFL